MRCEISHLLADHLAIPLKYQAVKLLSVQMRLRLNHSPGQNNDITLSLFLLCQTSTLTKDHLLINQACITEFANSASQLVFVVVSRLISRPRPRPTAEKESDAGQDGHRRASLMTPNTILRASASETRIDYGDYE